MPPVNRREVLAGASAPVIVPARALGRKGAVPPSDRLTMGAIGVGGMGGGHVRAFLQQPDVRLVAVCDVRQSAREKNKNPGQYTQTRFFRKRAGLFGR